LRRIGDHCRKIPMHERLPAGKVQEANAVALEDVASKLGFGERDGAPRFCGRPVAREAAKTASRVAGAGDREVASPRPAIPNRTKSHLPD